MITEEQKKQIFQADLANLLKKVKDGKPLTAAERKIIEDHGAGGKRIKAKTKLADALGIGYPTLKRYLDREDAPKPNDDGWDKDEVRDYIAKNGSRSETTMLAGDGTLNRAVLIQKREALLDQRTRQLELSNLRESGDLKRTADVQATFTKLAANIKDICTKIENEIPAATFGTDLAEARRAWREIADSILRAHQECSELWEKV
jgi:phage terminase Nu1 subunit (DNA packaging protein)